ncbi:MAG: hypothetical protein IH881_16560 [Myxococcales bacterium]|nr:hypothetical protein [Myxococcales bacterium]
MSEIRAMLADMRTMQARLDAKLNTLQSSADSTSESLNLAHTKLDMVDSSIIEVFESVNSVEVTTQVCMSAEFATSVGLGEHGEAGVGWPNVLDAKLVVQEDAGLALATGLGQEICIQIPLYSVFVEGQLAISPGAKNQLDELIALVSQPALNQAAVVGEIYYQTVPSPSAVTGVFEDLILAALPGGDPTIMIDPATYDPLVPPLMKTAIAFAPLIVEAAINDPCASIQQLDVLNLTTAAAFDPVCSIAADATFQAVTTIDSVLRIGLCAVTLGIHCP